MAGQYTTVNGWREQQARLGFNLDFEPLDGVPFRCTMTPIFDDLRAGRARFSPGFTFRDEDLVKDGDDAIGLMIAQSSDLDISHCGREVQLRRDEAAPMRVCATGRVGSRHAFGYASLLIPFSKFAERVACPDDAVMQHLRRSNEPLRLLLGYLRALGKNRGDALADGRALIREHLIDLAALAITRHASIGESTMSAVVAARLAAALEVITDNFQDPELSVESVSQQLQLSPRYLQRLMKLSGTAFTERVNELRLQKAFALLMEARGSPRRIADVALEVGFSDISHFNRLFRSRYGETPTGVRASARTPVHNTDSYRELIGAIPMLTLTRNDAS
jgi:AraC-like DNA-binding protein